jgi:hypothetical protein
MYLLFYIREVFSQANHDSKNDTPPAVIKMVMWALVQRGLMVYIRGVL